jgi:hypothetical protein
MDLRNCSISSRARQGRSGDGTNVCSYEGEEGSSQVGRRRGHRLPDRTTTTLALTALSAVAASIAAIAALKGLTYARAIATAALDGLKYARETVELGEQTAAAQWGALEAAQATVELAQSDRQVATLEREQRRLERIGELVETVFWNAQRAGANWGTGPEWMSARNQLSQATSRRPLTASLLC